MENIEISFNQKELQELQIIANKYKIKLEDLIKKLALERANEITKEVYHVN